MMPKVLTSWKEIAQYLGKGVRTVQRWEQYFGLPVRRPNADCHHAVLALPEELDAWLVERTRTRRAGSSTSELEELRRKLAVFEKENQALRLRVTMLDNARPGLDRPADTVGSARLSVPRLPS
jgi:phage terminase Nu1 subunit (DNA packaging protein)